MIHEDDCVKGEWYWACPIYDVDSDGNYEDQTRPVPAQYLGDGKWLWPDTEGDEWPCNGLVYSHIPRPEVTV